MVFDEPGRMRPVGRGVAGAAVFHHLVAAAAHGIPLTGLHPQPARRGIPHLPDVEFPRPPTGGINGGKSHGFSAVYSFGFICWIVQLFVSFHFINLLRQKLVVSLSQNHLLLLSL